MIPFNKPFMGQEMKWFQGVVEDRNDPQQLGRVRIRFFGLHTQDKNKLPTSFLPWAFPIQPITSAGVSGVGVSPTGPVPGTHVIGFFRDKWMQEPIYWGTLSGIPSNPPDTSKGFNDPTGTYPTNPGENDVNGIARGTLTESAQNARKKVVKNIGTITNPKGLTNEDVTFAPSSSEFDDSISEPVEELQRQWSEIDPFQNINNFQYPETKVEQEESGHVFVRTNTPGYEMIHMQHRTGSYIQFSPDGNIVLKSLGDKYDITIIDNFVYINGKCNVSIKGDVDLSVGGDINAIATNINMKAKENLKLEGKIVDIYGETTSRMTSPNDIHLSSSSSQIDNINTNKNVNVNSLKASKASQTDIPDPTFPSIEELDSGGF